MSTSGPYPPCRRSPPAVFWRTKALSSEAVTVRVRIQPFALDADIHLAFDIIPFLGRARHADQLLQQLGLRGLKLEPGHEIEGLAEVAAVVELAGDPREI